MRKWPLKKKNHISTSFKRTFKIAKTLETSSGILQKKQVF